MQFVTPNYTFLPRNQPAFDVCPLTDPARVTPEFAGAVEMLFRRLVVERNTATAEPLTQELLTGLTAQPDAKAIADRQAMLARKLKHGTQYRYVPSVDGQAIDGLFAVKRRRHSFRQSADCHLALAMVDPLRRSKGIASAAVYSVINSGDFNEAAELVVDVPVHSEDLPERLSNTYALELEGSIKHHNTNFETPTRRMRSEVNLGTLIRTMYVRKLWLASNVPSLSTNKNFGAVDPDIVGGPDEAQQHD